MADPLAYFEVEWPESMAVDYPMNWTRKSVLSYGKLSDARVHVVASFKRWAVFMASTEWTASRSHHAWINLAPLQLHVAMAWAERCSPGQSMVMGGAKITLRMGRPK